MKLHTMLLVVTAAFAVAAAPAVAADGHAAGHGGGSVSASAPKDVQHNPACVHCGMNRETFAHSRMLVAYEDGTKVGTCSINCVVVEQRANMGKKVASVRVADYGTKQLADAATATWVIGGDVKGVMTLLPKWAFAAKADADRFVASHGGRLASYAEALEEAGKDVKMRKKPAGQQ